MHINNPDALKSWLTEILEPLCDADPAALARYVLALLKKDKPEKDLRECMKEQLDVFLGHETEPFLEKLFRSIRGEEYIKVAAAKEVITAPVEIPPQAVVSTLQFQPPPVEDTSSGSSKVRIKKEFTPPLHENNTSSNGSFRSSKDVPAASVSSGEKPGPSTSHDNGSESSSLANSGVVSVSAAPSIVPPANTTTAVGKTPVKSSSNKDDHVSMLM